VPTVTIRVVLAEDNFLLRAGTAALLDALDGVELVAATADRDELMAAVEEHRPDVVITDIRMPPEHHIEGLTSAAGLWVAAVTRYYLLSLPLALAAIFAGRAVNRRLAGRSFLRYVHAALIVVGVTLLIQSVLR